MKKILRIRFLFVLLLVFSCSAYASEPNPTKKNIGGREYYLYKVQAGEGLYSISKRFHVTQTEINKINPQLLNGLKAGSTILIPVVNANEDVGNDEFIIHKVTRKQTLFAISRLYDVSIKEIIKANPQINENGLRYGTTIKIPQKKQWKSIENDKPTFVEKRTDIFNESVNQKKAYRIAYLLPFMSDQKEINPTAVKFINFYMGSLLAINNAKNGKIDFEVFTYDIKKNELDIHKVLNRPEMQTMDLIFGPAYTLQIPILADFAKRREIYTVVPFSSNVESMKSNPYLFQFNPNKQIQEDATFDFLRDRLETSNILFVKTENPTESVREENKIFAKKLKDNYISYEQVFVSEIKNNLQQYKNNLVVFDTGYYHAVSKTLELLYDESKDYDIEVIGQYSWRENKGKKPIMYYVSPFNGSLRGTGYYESEYEKYFNGKKPLINPRFDLLGYDLTNCFLSAMRKDSFTFVDKLVFQAEGVQSDLSFRKIYRKGGFVNEMLYLIKDEATNK